MVLTVAKESAKNCKLLPNLLCLPSPGNSLEYRGICLVYYVNKVLDY